MGAHDSQDFSKSKNLDDEESPSNMFSDEKKSGSGQTAEAKNVVDTVHEVEGEDSDEAEPAFLSARGLRFDKGSIPRRQTVDARGNVQGYHGPASPDKRRRTVKRQDE